MSFRIASVVALAVVAGAAAIAIVRPERTPELPPGAAPEPRSADGALGPRFADGAAAPRFADGASLPLSGPVAATAGPEAAGSGMGEAPGLAWQVPPGWQVVPSPNAMRIATYRVGSEPGDPDPVDVSVSRAGGSVEANIQRWLGQFRDPESPRRAEATVHGLPVTFVEMAGTYTAGNMGGLTMGGGAAPNGARAGYALVAVIVRTAGNPYFFKMVGPAQNVRDARKAFDGMVATFSPR